MTAETPEVNPRAIQIAYLAAIAACIGAHVDKEVPYGRHLDCVVGRDGSSKLVGFILRIAPMGAISAPFQYELDEEACKELREYSDAYPAYLALLCTPDEGPPYRMEQDDHFGLRKSMYFCFVGQDAGPKIEVDCKNIISPDWLGDVLGVTDGPGRKLPPGSAALARHGKECSKLFEARQSPAKRLEALKNALLVHEDKAKELFLGFNLEKRSVTVRFAQYYSKERQGAPYRLLIEVVRRLRNPGWISRPNEIVKLQGFVFGAWKALPAGNVFTDIVDRTNALIGKEAANSFKDFFDKPMKKALVDEVRACYPEWPLDEDKYPRFVEGDKLDGGRVSIKIPYTCLESSLDKARILAAMARLEWELENHALAMKSLEEALHLDPAEPSAHMFLDEIEGELVWWPLGTARTIHESAVNSIKKLIGPIAILELEVYNAAMSSFFTSTGGTFQDFDELIAGADSAPTEKAPHLKAVLERHRPGAARSRELNQGIEQRDWVKTALWMADEFLRWQSVCERVSPTTATQVDHSAEIAALIKTLNSYADARTDEDLDELIGAFARVHASGSGFSLNTRHSRSILEIAAITAADDRAFNRWGSMFERQVRREVVAAVRREIRRFGLSRQSQYSGDIEKVPTKDSLFGQ